MEILAWSLPFFQKPCCMGVNGWWEGFGCRTQTTFSRAESIFLFRLSGVRGGRGGSFPCPSLFWGRTLFRKDGREAHSRDSHHLFPVGKSLNPLGNRNNWAKCQGKNQLRLWSFLDHDEESVSAREWFLEVCFSSEKQKNTRKSIQFIL